MATCPTYQLLGSELDGPRGRIYLIKEMLETRTGHRQDPLASGPLPDLPLVRNDLPVRRALRTIDRHRPRDGRSNWRRVRFTERLVRKAMLAVIPYTSRMSMALIMARMFRPLLPAELRKKIPARQKARGDAGIIPRTAHAGAGWLRPAAGHPEHQCGCGARARPAGHLAGQRSRVPVAAGR